MSFDAAGDESIAGGAAADGGAGGGLVAGGTDGKMSLFVLTSTGHDGRGPVKLALAAAAIEITKRLVHEDVADAADSAVCCGRIPQDKDAADSHRQAADSQQS